MTDLERMGDIVNRQVEEIATLRRRLEEREFSEMLADALDRAGYSVAFILGVVVGGIATNLLRGWP